ncbi:MAG: hypothetical protein QNI86_06915 [Halieaceae bacterium]|nr:hypothetical protein [Halieaceae bacterium]
MKPELTIHIGRPKVGSTALQGFLNQNRQALAKQGVCYPKTGLYHGASHHFSLVFLPGLPDYPVVKDLRPDDLYQALADEVAASGLSRAVISSENFWLVKPAKLKPLLSERFDVKIVAYLRRQDEVMVSSFVQEIRGGMLSLDTAMDNYLADKGRLKLLDYDAMLVDWEKAFGLDNVNVRLYEAMADGIERDFLDVLGLNSKRDFRFAEARRNASPALDLLRMLETLRGYPVGEVAHRQLSGILTEVSEQLGSEGGLDPKGLISAGQRRQVMEQFSDSNRRLFERHDCGGQRFPELAAGTDTGEQQSVPEIPQPDRELRALLGIIAYQQRQIQVLANRVTHLERRGGTPSVPAPRAPAPQQGFFSRLLGRLRRR